MIQYTRLSIWEDDPFNMSWYDHVVGRKVPADIVVTSKKSRNNKGLPRPVWINNEKSEELAYQEAWFSELIAHDKKKGARHRGRMQPDDSGSMDISVSQDGRLPPGPYFEYMFADAELIDDSSGARENSIDNLSFGNEDQADENVFDMPPAPTDKTTSQAWQSSTLESTFQELHDTNIFGLCHHEPVLVETQQGMKGVLHECLAAIDNSLEACHLEMSHEDLLQEQQATIEFFSAEAPSDSRPLYKSTYSDSKEWLEVEQQRYLHERGNCAEQCSQQTNCEPARDTSQSLPDQSPINQSRSILPPKSQRLRFEATCALNVIGASVKERLSRRLHGPNQGSANTAQKRNREQLLHHDSLSGSDIGHHQTKKARLSSKLEIDESMSDEVVKSIVIQSILSDATSSRKASGDFFNHKPLAIAPKGYAGQFDGMVIKRNWVPDFKFNITSLDVEKSGVQFLFGDRRHPNGTFTHTSISFDPFCHIPDFTEANLPNGHPLFTCMNFATDMTVAAAHMNIVNLRNHDEEILRRESHIECAHARLEGVAVGYYRYYQGHLSVEEYHHAEMCIC